ncbi:MAG: ATP-binding protein [Candidatus Omnitrophota bacterium]|jgi:signal transduction histidine kinase
MPKAYFKAAEIFGFGSLIILIAAVGIIGIFQIEHLSNTIEALGTQHLSLQQAALEMRINNSLYGKGIRNLVFWQTTKFLEAAPRVLDLETQEIAAQNFDRYLSVYSSHTSGNPQQQEWVERLQLNVSQLRALGEEIIQKIETRSPETELAYFSELLMTFEDRLYKIDGFLSETVEKNILDEIQRQLNTTRTEKRNAIFLLSLCLLLSISSGGFIAIGVYQRNRREEEKKKQLLSQMLRIEDEERKNLSIQVHNEMGQDLSALKIYLDLGDLNQCRTILNKLAEKAHNIAYLLRPSALEEVGIVSALEALLLQYRQMTGYNYSYYKPEQEIKLVSEQRLILYRIAQEALTNITKYSKAQNVKLSLKKKENAVQLSVEDDGIGFDYNRFLQDGPKDRLGLLGLRERVELLGGRMNIESDPGKGTRIVAELNL